MNNADRQAYLLRFMSPLDIEFELRDVKGKIVKLSIKADKAKQDGNGIAYSVINDDIRYWMDCKQVLIFEQFRLSKDDGSLSDAAR